MVTFVLDASAVLRFVDVEPGNHRVREILLACADGKCDVIISAVNWGEVSYTLAKRPNSKAALKLAHSIFESRVEATPATIARAEGAGLLKLKYNIAYADAFGLELASDSPDHILVTADYGVKPAELDIRIEFLPTKPKQ